MLEDISQIEADSASRLLLTILVVACGVSFVVLIPYLDNTNLVTANGLWKSRGVASWVGFRVGTIDPSNFLYYPVTGALVTVLPESVFGQIWTRMAFANAGWATLALGSLAVALRHLGLRSWAIGSAILIQAGSAFFLALAITSEDIMGGYALLTLSFAACVISAGKPLRTNLTWMTSAGFLATLAFLWEWRLLFALFPAIFFAIFLSSQDLAERAARMVAFATSSALTLGAAAIAWWAVSPDSNLVGLARLLLWTGKGVGTGWGGLSSNKFLLVLFGMTEYVYGGRNLATEPEQNWESAVVVIALLSALGLYFLKMVSLRKALQPWRVAGALSISLLAFGQGMNLFSQPQDPQMQLTAMLWLPVAVGVVVEGGLRRIALSSRGFFKRRANVVGLTVMVLAGLLSLISLWGSNGYAKLRGGDSRSLAAHARLLATIDEAASVLVFHGFEDVVAWLSVRPGLTEGPPFPRTLMSSLSAKSCLLTSQAVSFPERSQVEAAQLVVGGLNRAYENGFRLLASPVWGWSEGRFEESFNTLSGDKAPEMYRYLHSNFCATPAFHVRGLGQFYELRPKAFCSAPL